MTFLEAIETVLKEENRPLSTKEIYYIAVDKSYIESSGETPIKTLNSKLSIDILRKKDSSVFMRTDEGVFGLRDWKGIYPEYKAKRFVKKKMDEDIAVFNKEDLISFIDENGLTKVDNDFSDIFSSHIYPMKRSEAETRFDVIQLVSVFIVVHENKVLTHMRSARLPEERLHGEYSVMLGGHLGIEDFVQYEMPLSFGEEENGNGALIRELSEELILETEPEIIRYGLIYDPSREVSSQHIGLIYVVKLSQEKYEIGERGFLMNPEFKTLKDIKEDISNYENWSVMLVENMEGILGNVRN